MGNTRIESFCNCILSEKDLGHTVQGKKKGWARQYLLLHSESSKENEGGKELQASEDTDHHINAN